MFGLGPMEIMIILVVALIFIGPQKLPEIAKSLGKSMRDLQRSANDFSREVSSEVEREPKPKEPPPEVPTPVPAAGQEAFGTTPATDDPYAKAAEEDAALATVEAPPPVTEPEPAPAPAPPTTKG